MAKVGWEWYQPTTLHNDGSEVSPVLGLHYRVCREKGYPATGGMSPIKTGFD